jgi:agmatine deiminase
MRTIFESESDPKADGFWVQGEHEPQERVWIGWPHRTDTWAFGAKPAQQQYADVIRAIVRFTPVCVCVNQPDYLNAASVFDGEDDITVIEMTTDDAWFRDTGGIWVVNAKGDKRLVHWHFNAYGGLVDGLYFPWDKDEQVGLKMAELSGCDRYRPEHAILEGGSVIVDGEGTAITTEMCLLSKGRTASAVDLEPDSDELRGYMTAEVEKYYGVDKVIWIKDGIDPQETNGHIDGVAAFVAPGVVLLNWTDDETHPYYQVCRDAWDTLSNTTDAKGRSFKLYKVPLTSEPLCMSVEAARSIDYDEHAEVRSPEPFYATYLNYLVTNGGIIFPEYGVGSDKDAADLVQSIYDETFGKGSYEVVSVRTDEIDYAGGNIHCITQNEPAARSSE